MALFKVFKGLKANLPSAKTAGYCWYTIDDSLFYIDYEDENGVVQRQALNAKDAETLAGASLATILNSSDVEIPTSKAVLTALSDFATNDSVASVKDELQANIDGKADSSHNHDTSDITSGTLSSDRLPTVPVSKGGTGATTAAGALTNLGLTATATELNYMDGVTSSVQTQLNKKASSSHTHSYLPLSGGTIDGRLSVHGYGNNGGLNLDGYQGRLELRAEIGTASIACVDGTNSASLIFSPNKPANEGVKFSMKKDGTLSLYKLYGEHNKPTANDIGAASTMSVTTAEYNTMAANNELKETTLYMLTDDTEEEDLQTTVNEMNNIDYEANLAFDVNEIV